MGGARALGCVVKALTLTRISAGLTYAVKVGTKAANALMRWIPLASRLHTLSLSRTGMLDSLATPVLRALCQAPSLTSLNVSDNQIGVVGAAALGKLITVLPALRTLDASWNNLGVEVRTHRTMRALGTGGASQPRARISPATVRLTGRLLGG